MSNNVPPPPPPNADGSVPQPQQYDQPQYQQPQYQQSQQPQQAYQQPQMAQQQMVKPIVPESARPGWTALVMIGFSALGFLGSFLPYASFEGGSLGFFSEEAGYLSPGAGTAVWFIIYFLATGGFAAGWFFSRIKGLRITAGVLGIVLGVLAFIMALSLTAAASLLGFAGVGIGIGAWFLTLAAIGIFVSGILLLAVKGSQPPAGTQPGGYPPATPSAY